MLYVLSIDYETINICAVVGDSWTLTPRVLCLVTMMQILKVSMVKGMDNICKRYGILCDAACDDSSNI